VRFDRPATETPEPLVGFNDPARFKLGRAAVACCAAIRLDSIESDFAVQLFVRKDHLSLIVLRVDGFINLDFVTGLKALLTAQRNFFIASSRDRYCLLKTVKHGRYSSPDPSVTRKEKL